MMAGGPTALGALALMLVLPSLVLARAPWPVAPLLSAALWVTSSAWMGVAGGSRERFLHAALAAAAVLAAVRALPKLGTDAARYAPPRHPDAALRRRGAALMLAVLGARLVPDAFWPLPPGTSGGYVAATALLTLWHDGPPLTLEPLYPARAGIDGVALLAADVMRLTGAPAERAMLAVALGAEGLLALALYAAATRVLRVPWTGAAALSALATAVAIPLPGERPGAVLVTAFAAAAAALLAAGSGRSGAVAAGVLLAAAAVTHPLAALMAVPLLLGAATVVAPRRAGPWTGPAPARLALAAAVAALGAAPAYFRPPLGEASTLAFTVLAVAAALALGAVAVVARGRAWPVLLAAAAIVTAITWWAASRRLVLDGPRIAAWRAAGARAPLDLRFCAPPGAEAFWVPAIAGRGTVPAVLPGRALPTGALCVPPP